MSKRKLRNLDINEIALVRKGSEPVNEDAIIELVKSQPDEAAEQVFISKFIKAIASVFKSPMQGDDMGLDNGGNDVGPQENTTNDGDVCKCCNEPEGGCTCPPGAGCCVCAGNYIASVASALVTDATDDDQDEDEAEADRGFVEALEGLQRTLADMNKARVGAAIMAEARQHVENMQAEANTFLKLLKQTADDVPLVKSETTQEDAMTPEEITKAIQDGIAAALPALKELITAEVAAQVEPVAKAMDSKEIEAARHKPAAHPLVGTHVPGVGPRRTPDVKGMDFSDALRTLIG